MTKLFLRIIAVGYNFLSRSIFFGTFLMNYVIKLLHLSLIKENRGVPHLLLVYVSHLLFGNGV